MVSKLIKENLLKNLLVLVTAGLLYPLIFNSISGIQPEQMNDFLLILSIFLVTASFANFAFTYEKSKLNLFWHKIISHTATFFFLLLTALILESLILCVKVVYPSFSAMILIFSILLYVGIIFYDIWDISRFE